LLVITLIDGFCKVNKSETTKKLLGEMVSKGINVTCNIVMDALCKKGGTDEAEEPLDHMLNK
jgi:pentatricopeptide repeat protein